MLPWPVISIIIAYANNWHLRSVCRRFKIIVESCYKFNFSDFQSIATKSTFEVFQLYYKQHKYKKCPCLDFKDTRIFEFLLQKVISTDFVTYFYNACLTGNVEIARIALKSLVAENSSITISSGIENAYANGGDEIIELFSPFLEYNSTSIIKGVYRSGNISLYSRINNKLQNNMAWDDKFILSYACLSGNPEFIKMICGTVNYTHQMIISLFKTGNMEIIKLINPPDNLDEYMCNACCGGQFEVVKYLVEEKKLEITELNILNTIYGKNLKTLMYLGEKKDYDLNKALACACNLDVPDIVEYLIKKGAVPTETNLETAICHGCLDVVKILVNSNMRITECSVIFACCFGYYDICHYFINRIDVKTCGCADKKFTDKCPFGRHIKNN